MNKQELEQWFAANKTFLESAYMAGQQPWQQSGFGVHSARTYEQWAAHRKPVADAVNSSGTFLDIGCANGYLLECMLHWAEERALTIVPFGLDLSEHLIALAKLRLPTFTRHMFADNAWNWTPPQTFDYVRTELVYVPDELHREYVARILDRYLHTGGRLLAAEYRARDNTDANLSVDSRLKALGFTVEAMNCGYWQGLEVTRIAVVRKSD
ncbi:MAG: class I SAM-dependent methyltransferase [Chloroflexota bacterium]|nr:class I SAM-dependent methyltransferase [Chloroflexota bacterium]